MNCKDIETAIVCFRAEDGSKVAAVAHYEYGINAADAIVLSSTRFTDSFGNILDPLDFAEVSLGLCNTDTQCVESQEWTYGLDNTGTNYRWRDATYEVTLSDGSTFQFQQTAAANGGWTPQMQEWGSEIQAAADAAGIKWFVETRFRDASDPTNLAGGGGFSGPPSLAISNALTNMLWRYVNIQICPGQPVPTGMQLIAVDDANGAAVPALPYDLTTDGAVLGPISKFWMCTECGQEPVWYLEDGVTLAEAGQIPNCWEPCGTLALTEAPPDRDCQFFFTSACDNQNDPDPTSWIQDITRRTTVCNGEILSVDYFEADPGDPTALVSYELLGVFVDCASGEPIDDVIPECSNYEYVGLLWKFRPSGEVGTLIEWWQDPDDGGNSAPHDTPSNIFSLVGNRYEHVNGAPTASYLAPTFSTATSSNEFIAGMGIGSRDDSNGTDQLKLSGYINMPRAGVVSDTNSNTGERGLFAIQYCCQGDMVTLAERDNDSVSGDTGIFTNVPLPAGIHYVEIMTSDLSAWQGMEFSLSFDGGETTQPFESSTGKPYYECIPVLKCLENGLLVHAETGVVIDVEFNDTWCEPECSSPAGDDPNTPLLQEIADKETCVVAELFSLSDLTGTLHNREWDLGPRTSSNMLVSEGRAIRESFDFSAPTTVDGDWTTFTVNDTNGSNEIQDAQVIDGFIKVDEPIQVRWTGGSLGYLAVELGVCCGSKELVLEASSGSGNINPSQAITLPKGVHEIRLWNIDDYTNTSRTAQYSLDGGVTWTSDNTPPGIELSRTKPDETCVKVKIYEPSGVITELLSDTVVDTTDLYECSVLCQACCGGGSGSSPTAQEIAAAVLDEERARTSGRMENWQNEGGTVSLDVPPGTMGCIKTITDYGTGAVYWTIDGTTPSASNGSTMSVQYGNTVDLCGIDLSLVRLDGSSAGSDFSIVYEVWT